MVFRRSKMDFATVLRKKNGVSEKIKRAWSGGVTKRVTRSEVRSKPDPVQKKPRTETEKKVHGGTAGGGGFVGRLSKGETAEKSLQRNGAFRG